MRAGEREKEGEREKDKERERWREIERGREVSGGRSTLLLRGQCQVPRDSIFRWSTFRKCILFFLPLRMMSFKDLNSFAEAREAM